MLPTERVIGERGLSAGAAEGRLEIRLPWYRSLPLSTVLIERLAIDGSEIAAADLRFELNGKCWSLVELADQTNMFWYVLDSAFLVFPGQALVPDSRHEVTLTLTLFPPYIPGMKRVNTQTETLLVHALEAAR